MCDKILLVTLATPKGAASHTEKCDRVYSEKSNESYVLGHDNYVLGHDTVESSYSTVAVRFLPSKSRLVLSQERQVQVLALPAHYQLHNETSRVMQYTRHASDRVYMYFTEPTSVVRRWFWFGVCKRI